MGTEFALTSPEPRAMTALDLMELALSKDAAIDVIERVAKLRDEEREYQAKRSFDDALSRCQEKLSRISADCSNDQTHSKYASYAKIDRVIRPIYTAEGFSVSFGEAECPTPGKTRFVAHLSRSGHTRTYFKDLTPSPKGPKGNDVMTQIHAEATADSYAKRYLVKNIFNIAIGEDDADGNSTSGVEEAEFVRHMDNIQGANNIDELKRLYFAANKAASDAKDQQSQTAFAKAKNQRYRELSNAH